MAGTFPVANGFVLVQDEPGLQGHSFVHDGCAGKVSTLQSHTNGVLKHTSRRRRSDEDSAAAISMVTTAPMLDG